MKKSKSFSHVDTSGNPSMVDVSGKQSTYRVARAEAIVDVGSEILKLIVNDELVTRKGPVFQTAIIAGVMASKKTSELIPLCHPLPLDDCQIRIEIRNKKVRIEGSVSVHAKTGVEMEALTAVSVAALTLYDMCKALSHDIEIKSIRLLEKTGRKSTYKRHSS